MARLSAALVFGFLSIVLVAGSGFSGDKEKKVDGKFKGMLPAGWKALELTAEQKSKVYSIQKMYKSKVSALEDQITELKSQERSDMFKVLTDEQKTLLRKLTTGEEPKGKTVEKKDKVDDKK